jgi:hypothetical protein
MGMAIFWLLYGDVLILVLAVIVNGAVMDVSASLLWYYHPFQTSISSKK